MLYDDEKCLTQMTAYSASTTLLFAVIVVNKDVKGPLPPFFLHIISLEYAFKGTATITKENLLPSILLLLSHSLAACQWA